jgi:lipoprotein-releasing system permease protein
MTPEPLDFAALPPVPRGRPWRAERWLAMGHLLSSGQVAALIVAVFAVFAVTLGVATVNIVLSVMSGFEIDLRDKILGANAHLVVLRYNGNVLEPEETTKKVLETPGVVAAAPFVYSEAMIRSPWAATGIILKGLDPERTGDVTDLRHDLILGPDGELADEDARAALFALMGTPLCARGHEPGDPECEPLPRIFLGEELQKQLQVDPLDRVQVIDPLGGGTGLMGMPTPRVKNFRVAGVYKSGMYEYDTKWTYVDNGDAQAFLDIGDAVTGIEVKVADIDDVETPSALIEAKLGYPNYCRNWKDLNQKLFAALALEKYVMGLILFMIVLVSSWLIMTTVIMVVLDKRREIAVLKAMGASSWSILRIFLIEGAIVGFLGTIAGTVLGITGCWFLDWYGYPLETDVYFLSRLPVVIEYENVLVIAIAAFLTCTLVTLFPAGWAATQDPIAGLRDN